MQTLDVISVNFWQILVSLINLVILFLIVKQFLYKPVKKMLSQRGATIDGLYGDAEEAKARALADAKTYEEKLAGAKAEADEIIRSAVSTAKARENEIIADAKEEAVGILHEARENAALEMKKAEDTVKNEIADVSILITEKLLEREINKDDHKALIDSFIEEMGDENDRNK